MTKAVVLYCDILGFSELINAPTDDQAFEKLSKEISDAIDFGLEFLKNYQNILDSQGFSRIIGNMKHKLFSDNLYVAMDYEESDDFLKIVSMLVILFARSYQLGLLAKHSINVRGGISFGANMVTENTIFSRSLLEAVHLEQHVAVYPRIVLDNSLVSILQQAIPEITQNPLLKNAIVRDWSGVQFVNPFNFMEKFGNAEKKIQPGSDAMVIRAIISRLSEKKRLLDAKKDYRVIEKLTWMIEFARWSLNPGDNNLGFSYVL